jgi:hypothetical protein
VTIRTALRRPAAAVLLAALLLASPFGLAACGGAEGDERDAEALLDRAFSRSIDSADLDIDAQLEVDGLADLEDPIRIRASGPYVKSEKSLPQLDVDLDISVQGAGQSIQSGILSTGDRVFLKFGGGYYEQPAAQVAQTNRRLARGGDQGGGSLSELGLDARRWIVDAKVEGDEEVGGVQTEHVTGTLDVKAVVDDLNGLVKRSTASGGGDAKPQPLDDRAIERLSKTVGDPSFDVYVGKDDDVIRRVSLRIEVAVPADDRKDVGGITGASIRFSAELDDVGGDQEVQAPRTSRPLSELTSQIGNLGALAGGFLGGGGGGAATTPDSGGGASGTDGGGGGVEDFERYGDCLERATPDDAEAISRCAELLN